MLTVRSVSFGIGKTANTRDVHLELKMAGAVDLIGELQMTGYQVQAYVLDIFTKNVTSSLAFLLRASTWKMNWFRWAGERVISAPANQVIR